MATDAAKGKRRALAVQRIERQCQTLSGGQSLKLPTFSRHGVDVLLILQLEALADFLEAHVQYPQQPQPTTQVKTTRKKVQDASAL
jgi:hypothetical protein